MGLAHTGLVRIRKTEEITEATPGTTPVSWEHQVSSWATICKYWSIQPWTNVWMSYPTAANWKHYCILDFILRLRLSTSFQQFSIINTLLIESRCTLPSSMDICHCQDVIMAALLNLSWQQRGSAAFTNTHGVGKRGWGYRNWGWGLDGIFCHWREKSSTEGRKIKFTWNDSHV